jgi:hypothetical protein
MQGGFAAADPSSGSTRLRRPPSIHAGVSVARRMAWATRIQETPAPAQEMTNRWTVSVRQPPICERQVVISCFSRSPTMA